MLAAPTGEGKGNEYVGNRLPSDKAITIYDINDINMLYTANSKHGEKRLVE